MAVPVRGARPGARPAPALPPLAEAFLRELTALRRLSPNTSSAYRRDLERLVGLHGEAALAGATSAEVRRYAARLHGAGLAPASIARMLSAWRSFYRWLGQRGEVAVNPVQGVRAPRRAKRLPKALPVDRAVQLAAHEPDDRRLAIRDKAIVELLYSSGLRLSELVGLDWRHFAADRAQPASAGWIELEAAQTTVTGKGGKRRSVPIGRAAATALRAWLAVRGQVGGEDERALFLSMRGTRLSPRAVQQRLALLARRLGLGIHVHPHVLRHSMASHLLQSSGDLRAVQELLGHANIATTQVYTRLDWQHLARSYDAAHPRAKRKP
jgi:integrase/recombinase XerC